MPKLRVVKEFYFRDLQALREEITGARALGKQKSASVALYVGDSLATELTMQLSNLYIVAFRGQDRVYDVGEFGGENYNQLGMPPTMTLSHIDKLPNLGRFQKGMKLDTQTITIAAIVVSEAARFMGVSMHIQGLLSQSFTSISLAALNKKYFTMWSHHSERIRSGVFTPGEQVSVDVLL